MNKKALTIMELILVLVIISIGAALAIPKLNKSIEHRQAKAALNTLRSITHAYRMYHVSRQGAAFPGVPAGTFLSVLTTGATGTRYLSENEFSRGFEYRIVGEGTDTAYAEACRPNCTNSTRTIRVPVFNPIGGGSFNRSMDGPVIDSDGFLQA